MDYSAFRDIVFEHREHGILWMTLSRPSKLNVADAGLHQAFGDIWPVIDRDPNVRVAAGDHSAIIWPLLCGMAKAKYYLITSDFIDGREAERIGLVSLCVPDDQLQGKAMEVATRIATGPRHAIKFTKRVLNQWLLQAGPIFDHSLALEMMGFFDKDLLAGIEGLQNKRPARFPSAE